MIHGKHLLKIMVENLTLRIARKTVFDKSQQPCQVRKTPTVVKKAYMYIYINDQKINMKFMSVNFGIWMNPQFI